MRKAKNEAMEKLKKLTEYNRGYEDGQKTKKASE